ncbi:hypothetical protein BCR32DRAFT_288111, partial [Anaeromyces robustus]
VKNNNFKLLKLLVNNGADINIKNKKVETVIDLARKQNSKLITNYLEKKNNLKNQFPFKDQNVSFTKPDVRKRKHSTNFERDNILDSIPRKRINKNS